MCRREKKNGRVEGPSEKAMASHSSTLAWKIPWTEEPARLRSWTRLSSFTFTFHIHALQKEMATHSSVLAWRIPGTGEPGGLPSMGSHRVGHDWSNLAAAAASWKRYNFKKSDLGYAPLRPSVMSPRLPAGPWKSLGDRFAQTRAVPCLLNSQDISECLNAAVLSPVGGSSSSSLSHLTILSYEKKEDEKAMWHLNRIISNT